VTFYKGWAEEGGKLQGELDRRAPVGSPRWRELTRERQQMREWQDSMGRCVEGHGRDVVTMADFGGPRRKLAKKASAIADEFALEAKDGE